MNTDPIGNVNAFMRLNQGADLGNQVGTAVLKKALDSQSAEAAQIVKLINPNVGSNVDVQA